MWGSVVSPVESGRTCDYGINNILQLPRLGQKTYGSLNMLIFLKIFFFMWTTLKVFIKFVTIMPLIYALVFWPKKILAP